MSRARTPPQGAQLALRFPLRPRSRLEDFETGNNAELVARLSRLGQGAGFRGCFLHGAPGSGRTHLLQAACQQATGSAIYLPLRETSVTPDLLEGLEVLSLVALDDVDTWLGDDGREAALLALYQGLHGAGAVLLASARRPPAELSFRYRDLASRLAGLPTYAVRELDDAGKARVLSAVAHQRGLVLAPAVLDFWLARSGRALTTLLEELDRLDEAALAAQRRVTVPLLKEVLGL